MSVNLKFCLLQKQRSKVHDWIDEVPTHVITWISSAAQRSAAQLIADNIAPAMRQRYEYWLLLVQKLHRDLFMRGEMDCFSHSKACMMAAGEREKRSTEPRGMRCRPSAFLVYSNHTVKSCMRCVSVCVCGGTRNHHELGRLFHL